MDVAGKCTGGPGRKQTGLWDSFSQVDRPAKVERVENRRLLHPNYTTAMEGHRKARPDANEMGCDLRRLPGQGVAERRLRPRAGRTRPCSLDVWSAPTNLLE